MIARASSQSFVRARVLWKKFFFEPASARPLAGMRIAIALVLLAQAYLLRGSVLDFFAQDGIIQGELAIYLADPHVPRIAWLLHLFGSGASEAACIYAVCGIYVASLVGLGLGFRARFMAFVAWLAHWTLTNTGMSTTYGVDLYAHVFLFYLIWVPSGDAWSVERLFGISGGGPSIGARLGLRILQLHLCISYLSSGLEKARGVQWWNGELLWRALSLPEYHVYDFSWLAWWPGLSRVAGWSTLVLELGYCVFIWPRATRRLWVLGIVGLHLGIALFLGLGLFGVIMCILTAALFGISAAPEGERVRARPRALRLADSSPLPGEI